MQNGDFYVAVRQCLSLIGNFSRNTKFLKEHLVPVRGVPPEIFMFREGDLTSWTVARKCSRLNADVHLKMQFHLNHFLVQPIPLGVTFLNTVSKIKDQSSNLERLFSLKRGKRDVRALSFDPSKMIPPVGLSVQYNGGFTTVKLHMSRVLKK